MMYVLQISPIFYRAVNGDNGNIFAIIGAVNWGLIGLFRFDLVAFIFGDMTWLSRIVYSLVGLCGLYLLTFYMNIFDRTE